MTIKKKNKVLILFWIPSHIGLNGNGSSDKLAAQATTHELSTQFEQTKNDLKAYIRKLYKEKWRKKLNATQANKISEITDNIYMLPSTVYGNRQWDRCLTRLRIGHSKFKLGHYMSREPPPICRNCGENTPLTIKHILTKCPSLNTRRRQFFGSTNKTMNDSSAT